MWFFSFSLIDWNNPAIINKMYKVYLGDIPLKTKEVRFVRLSSESSIFLIAEEVILVVLFYLKNVFLKSVTSFDICFHWIFMLFEYIFFFSVAVCSDLQQKVIYWCPKMYYFIYFWQGSVLKPEMKRESVSTRVKLKIVPHLLRSRQAAEMFPANIQVMLIFQSYTS